MKHHCHSIFTPATNYFMYLVMKDEKGTLNRSGNLHAELLHLTRKLAEAPLKDFDETINSTLLQIGQTLGMDHGCVYEWSKPDEALVPTHEWSAIKHCPMHGLAPKQLGTMYDMLCSSENVQIPSFPNELPINWFAERRLLESLRFKSLLLFPLVSMEKVIGFIELGSVQLNRILSKETLQLVNVWAALVSGLIQNRKSELLLQQCSQQANSLIGEDKNLEIKKISNETFTQVFRTNPALMAITRLSDGAFLEVNDAFLRTLGYDRSEIVGKSTLTLGFLQPKERERMVESIRNNRAIRNFELVVRTKTGVVKVGLMSCDSLWVNNQHCLITVITDITERKIREVMLRKISDDTLFANLPQRNQMLGFNAMQAWH